MSFVVFRRRFVAANLRVFFALPMVVRRGEEFARTLWKFRCSREGFSGFPEFRV